MDVPGVSTRFFKLRMETDSSPFEAKVIRLGLPGGVASEVMIIEVLSQGPGSCYARGDTIVATLDELTPLTD